MEELVREANVLKIVTIKEIKALLAVVVENLADKEIDQDDLKDVLGTLIESVVLDATDFSANLTYKISGEALASPRSSELIPTFSPHSVVYFSKRRASA